VSGPSLAYVALSLVSGIGRARMDALLARFGTAEAVVTAASNDLRDVPGITPAAATAIRGADRNAAERLLRRTSELGGVPLAPDDPRFPRALRAIPDPPVLLFAAGRLDLAERPAVAIVGSRTHTRYGAEACRYLAGGCARAGLVVVSGMARGIDALAHGAALDAAGGTIGVLGNGLGVVYPSANRALYGRMGKDGLLLTEFPPGERPNAGSFPRRNRLISGLSRATLVIEAREKSGALITVDTALAQGRDVLAVPGPITSPCSVGCNRLIQSGAKLVIGLRDVLEEYGIAVDQPVMDTPTTLTDAERRIWDALADEERHVDELAEKLDLAPGPMLSLLTGLELRGLIYRGPGSMYGKRSREGGARGDA
jgi:DNA processing protein